MKKENMFYGTSPNGWRAEIREADDGFSLFRWRDTQKTGITHWQESHGKTWLDAFALASQWLDNPLPK